MNYSDKAKKSDVKRKTSQGNKGWNKNIEEKWTKEPLTRTSTKV
jgi:hypothetical protein